MSLIELCAERDLAGRHNTGGLGSGRAGCYPTLFRVLNPRAARAGCAVFVMGARPRSVRTRIAHAACPQDPEVVITHNLLVIVRLLFCLLSLLRILEPPKLPTSARREQSSPVYPDRPQRAKLARLGVAFAIAVLPPLRHSCCLRFARRGRNGHHCNFYQSLTRAIDKGLLYPASDFVNSQATLRQRASLPQRKVLF